MCSPLQSAVPITLREIRLADCYAGSRGVLASARKAGMTVETDNSLRVSALQILQKPVVREYLRRVVDEAMEDEKITLRRAAEPRRVRAAHGDFPTRRGDELPPGEWPAVVWAAWQGST